MTGVQHQDDESKLIRIDVPREVEEALIELVNRGSYPSTTLPARRELRERAMMALGCRVEGTDRGRSPTKEFR
ncbi:MAG: hypothetical protein DRO93_15600 [Candidatus Thorarchaeota archaeon]|nr:MAG: hypothetical protein DRO93_15600 [Candidatus Thorarchaeota archaeon]